MKKLLLTSLLVAGCMLTAVQAQAVIQLKGVGTTAEFCAGFTDENIVEVQLQESLPLEVSATTNLEFYWTAHHLEGTWTWRTDRNKRRMLIPFPGEYSIMARVLYINEGSISPFASFWSNQVKLTAEECN